MVLILILMVFKFYGDKMKSILLGSLLLSGVLCSQESKIPSYYNLDHDLSKSLKEIVVDLELDQDFDVGEDGIEQISLAVIDLTNNKYSLAGYNMDNFIYPASVYKMYVAAEVLNQISQGKYKLEKTVFVNSPNDVDKSKEIKTDPRPLLKDGDKVTVNYLLDLMITRSDNSAANCLIDLAKRENINQLIENFGWQGSEVTRKFLSRKFEDLEYKTIRGTETCALHAADFMFRIENNTLVNPWVSMQLKTYLGRQLDKSKLAQGIPDNMMLFHKTGWFSYWTNDVGIIDNGKVKYIVSCFIPLKEKIALEKFEVLAKQIHQIILNSN